MIKFQASFLLSSFAVLVSCDSGKFNLVDKCVFHDSGLLLSTTSENIIDITATFGTEPLYGNSIVPFCNKLHGVEIKGSRFQMGICTSEFALRKGRDTVYVLYTIKTTDDEVFSYSTSYQLLPGGSARDTEELIGLCSVPFKADVRFMKSGITLDIEAENVYELNLYISKDSFSGNTEGSGFFKKAFLMDLPYISYGICLPELQNLVPSSSLYIRYTITDKNGHISEQYKEYEVPEEGALSDTDEFSKMCSFPLKGSMNIHRSGVELAIEAENIEKLTVRIGENALAPNAGPFRKVIDFTDKSSYKFGLCRWRLANLAVGETVYVWYSILDKDGLIFERSESHKVPPTGFKNDAEEFISLCSVPLNSHMDFFESGVVLTITNPEKMVLTAQFSTQLFGASAVRNKEQKIKRSLDGQISFFACRSELENLHAGGKVYVSISIEHKKTGYSEQFLEYAVPDGGVQPDSPELEQACTP